MKRLPFRLPDFTRFAWVSDGARAVWAPRVERVGAAWEQVEWRSVAAGVRRVAHRIVRPDALPALVEAMAGHGLLVTELAKVGTSGAPYRATAPPPLPGQPFILRVAIVRPEDRADVEAAWRDNDPPRIGAHLGYPSCCSHFFDRVWEKERHIDTTWPMVEGLAGERMEIEVEAAPEANVLLRWLGVRAVPHLPCSFDCQQTIALGRLLLGVMREAGFAAEADWLHEMLCWPVEWSACHGIAEIKTPVVKIVTCTDATAEVYRLRLQGSAHPAEGAQGLAFPYRRPARLRVLESGSYQRGLRNPIC